MIVFILMCFAQENSKLRLDVASYKTTELCEVAREKQLPAFQNCVCLKSQVNEK